MGRNDSVNIKVDPSTRENLKEIKEKFGYGSYNEFIKEAACDKLKEEHDPTGDLKAISNRVTALDNWIKRTIEAIEEENPTMIEAPASADEDLDSAEEEGSPAEDEVSSAGDEVSSAGDEVDPDTEWDYTNPLEW